MSTRGKIIIGGVVVSLIAFFINFWLGLILVVATVGIPVAGYLMLDPSQRKRLNNQARKRLG